MIYGNYPSLGSSINWLLLGDGSSCCLVGGSSTVRGDAGEFKDGVYEERIKLCYFVEVVGFLILSRFKQNTLLSSNGHLLLKNRIITEDHTLLYLDLIFLIRIKLKAIKVF